MKLTDIINQLLIVLPNHIDLFTDDIIINSITSSGTIATVTTLNPHNLITGNYAHISGALVPNPIINLTRNNGIVSAETQNNHDLIQTINSNYKGYPENIEIIGANEVEYNGIFELKTVLNRKNFTYQITTTPSTPATGSPLLLELLKFGYNGWFEITKIDDNNFSYTLPQSMESPAYGNIKCKVNPRISAAITLDRAIESYTKQLDNTKIWAFVIMGNMAANKDRAATTDATYTPGTGTEFRQLTIQTANIYTFIPSKTSIAARFERDLVDGIVHALCKSLARVKFSSGFFEEPYNGMVFSSSSFGDYRNSFYIQEVIFEETAYITYNDTVDPDFGTAFRDINIDYKGIFLDNTIMTDLINLDDEPL